MKLRVRLPLVMILALLSLLLAASGLAAGPDPGPSHHNGPPPKSSRAPDHVGIRLDLGGRALVAGETGSLKLEAGLPAGENLAWDPTVSEPVTLWIATPAKSGIAFIDPAHPQRPRHHILVRFQRPAANLAQPLSAKVNYTVTSRAKAGKHSFWLDIFAELKGPEGQAVHDTGALRLPFAVDTHLRTKLLMLAVVAAAVFLFIVEWVRVDVVAIVMMVLLPELGLLNATDTFRGLSSNAVVAIIGVMIISYGLNRAGLVHRIIQPILGFVSKSPNRLVVTFSGLIAGISGVMQNTGAAVLFLPAIRSVTFQRLKVPISRVLMPIGMAAILGGTLTMIGTSPLILLNDILPPGMPKFGFLELTPIGAAIAIGGIAYLSTAGMKMLAKLPMSQPDYQTDHGGRQEGFLASYPEIKGPYELEVPAGYRPNGGPQELVEIRRRFLVNIVAVSKAGGALDFSPLPSTSLQPGYCLCAYGPEKSVRSFAREYGLEMQEQPKVFKDTMFNPSLAGIVEGVVLPRSSLIGQTIKEIRFRETFGVNPLAVHQGDHTYYQELADLPLQSGDTILLHGTWERFQALQELHQNFIIITPFEQEFHKPEKAKWAGICFLVALAMMVLSSFYFQNLAYNPIPLSVCLMVGAVGMVLCKVITISEAYHAVDWRTVFLLGGLIPLGMAVDQTGTANWIAEGIVAGLGSLMSPALLLAVLALLSAAFTLVISNVGAATLLVPLGISIAQQIGMDPRVCAIVVGLGVSNSFLLPTHQVNALYMGPGEYRTKDYIRIGGGLSFVYIVVLVAMTYVFYL
ncbi:MAG: SLC13 family permease [Desulfarculaceae bacterium]|nr:SLC13 family permease [Desulfarculaceae bacterium]MCF8073586.1 SLC13 family permease [Desulfarculaceae bacterium]MCF8103743.1 SLC13 family permease [Desulfarculaceae bacterium]MCF8115698.1 SLC13 family permease [Desulfarculaceae bacterium]